MSKAEDLLRHADMVAIAQSYGLIVEKEGAEWKACCPFHDEGTPSWKIFRGKDGKQRYQCFGCDAKGDTLDLIKHMEHLADTKAAIARLEEIVGGLAPTPAPHFAAPSASSSGVEGKKKKKSDTKPGRLLEVYEYPGPDEVVRFEVCRFEAVDSETLQVVPGEKKFKQRHTVNGRHVWSLEGVERVLYRLPAVMRADRVFLVEGEKDVHAIESLGLVGTTIPGGAKAPWFDQYTAALAGKQVVLAGDTDARGQEHMARCVKELRDHSKLFKCVLPGAKDPHVFIIEQGHTLADLEALVEPLVLPAKVIELPNPPSAGAKPTGGSGHGGGGGAGGGDLPPDGSDGPDPRWEQYLLKNREGVPRALLANVLMALRLSPEWHGVLRLNEFSRDVTASRAFPGRRTVPERGLVWTDTHDVLLTEWLHHRGIAVGADVAGKAVQAIAEERPFHPVREYLESLRWDEVPRIEHWLVDHAGVEDTEYVRAVSSRWLISAVARVYEPGCKADCCLILESAEQGVGKSTAFRVLGAPWFTDEMADLGSKDSAIQTQGVWIVELSELDSMRRAEQGRIKAFISRPTDRYRPPYGHRAIDSPRQCVFGGTVNHSQYLADETGGRRFWPIAIPGAIDNVGLAAARDQIWAEALLRYRKGVNWWLDQQRLKDAAALEQKDRYEGDPWQSRIAEWLAYGRSETSVEVLLDSCIQKPFKDWTLQDRMRVGRCLIALGWQKFRATEDGQRVHKYRRPDTA